MYLPASDASLCFSQKCLLPYPYAKNLSMSVRSDNYRMAVLNSASSLVNTAVFTRSISNIGIFSSHTFTRLSNLTSIYSLVYLVDVMLRSSADG